MAVGASLLTASGATLTQSSFTTVSVSPGADHLILVWVHSDSTVPTSITGNGLTWEKVLDDLGLGNPIACWRSMGAAPSAGAITINFASNQTTLNWVVVEYDTTDTSGTNGSGAIVQSNSGSASTGTSLTITLPSGIGAGNAVAAGIAHGSAESQTAGSGYTKLGEHFEGASIGNLAHEWAAVGTTTPSMSWATSDNNRGIAVEIKVAAGGAAVGPPVQRFRPGYTWQRRFHHRQRLPTSDVTAAAATNAPADVALATGTAFNPSVKIEPVTTTGTGTGTANNPTMGIAPGSSSAAGTGTANNPSPSIFVNAGLASATGVANNPTVTTGGAATNAPAGLASGTGTADNPTIKITPVPGLASGTGVANDTTSKVSPTPTTATAIGTAFNPTVLTGAVANAGHAAGTGTANNATSKIAPVVGTASGTGTANNPTVTVGTLVPAGLASGTGTANNATIAIGRTALAGLATATGVANSATLAIRASAEAAVALGVANTPTIPTALIYGRSSLGTGRATAGVASAGATSAGRASTSLTSVGVAGTGTAPRGTPGSGTAPTGKPGGD